MDEHDRVRVEQAEAGQRAPRDVRCGRRSPRPNGLSAAVALAQLARRSWCSRRWNRSRRDAHGRADPARVPPRCAEWCTRTAFLVVFWTLPLEDHGLRWVSPPASGRASARRSAGRHRALRTRHWGSAPMRARTQIPIVLFLHPARACSPMRLLASSSGWVPFRSQAPWLVTAFAKPVQQSRARALFAGCAVSVLPLDKLFTVVGLFSSICRPRRAWLIASGSSHAIPARLAVC